jgi:metal-sulfur cluster biosynthetic enzyme
MTREQNYDYDGPEALREPVLLALHRVVDPEVAMSIVNVGLVYAVTVAAGRLHVRMTMTSAACPVTDVILDDVQAELEDVVPADIAVEVELVWEPPWSTERMSASAKAFMGW